MTNSRHLFSTLKSLILGTTLLLFPLFFLPITQEYFSTNKFYLITLSAVLLLLISAVELLFSKKIQFKVKKIQLFKLFFLGTIFFSVLINSPNKIQAFLNPNFGLILFISLVLFTFYLEKSAIVVFEILSFSGLITSAVTIFFFFRPFRTLSLPVELEFLKNRFFTPLGNQLDLAIFLGFLLVTAILQLFFSQHNWKRFNFPAVYHLLVFFSTLAALIVTVFSLFSGAWQQLMPIKYAWYGFSETLKNPLTALFGVGVDNFSYLFTRVRDVAFNQSPLWQTKTFDSGPSTLLHLAGETGLLGLVTIIYIIYSAYKNGLKGHPLLLLPLIYLTLVLIFLPPSLTVFFLLFIGLTIFEEETNSNFNHPLIPSFDKEGKQGRFDVTYFIVSIFLLTLSLSSFFLLSRSYLAEYYFKESANALAHGQGKLLYQYQRKAILTNPYIERFHTNFSQTNLLLTTILVKNAPKEQMAELEGPPGSAQSRAIESEASTDGRATVPSDSRGESSDRIWSKEIIQAGQIAIIEAKNAIALNPQKAANWENLGLISRNLINVFNGADKEAVTAYEQAIIFDSQNPNHRYSLGSLYYAQKDFDNAARAFEQAVLLKPDWANAHYTLAWSLYQKQEFSQAIAEMETVIRLFDPKKNKAERAKAQEDLAMMKQKSQPQSFDFAQDKPPEENELILPSPPVASLEPKLDLPDADLYPASPEATPESF